MKTIKKTHAAIALAATAGLVAAPLAMGSQAFATAGEGQIEIAANQENVNVKYNAVKIFTGKVSNANEMTDFEWADLVEGEDGVKTSEIQNKVADAVSKWVGEDAPNLSNAQDAAEFIQKNIDKTTYAANNDKAATTNKDVLNAKTFGMILAEKLAGTSGTEVIAGEAKSLDPGYYVIETTSGNMGTAPIYATVGGAGVNVTEKTSDVPTLDKKIEGAQDSSVNFGDTITYTLTANVANNVRAYETYQFDFSDTLGEGLSAVEADGKIAFTAVELNEDGTDGANMTKYFTGSAVADGAFTIKANDDFAANVNPGATIKVTYQATIDKDADAEDGLSNKAKLTYSNDPKKDSNGKYPSSDTIEDEAKAYSYALKVKKVDDSTKAALGGVKFTIEKDGQYVQSNSTLGDDKYVFETGDDGLISLKGLAEGTYTITETESIAGYQPVTGDGWSFNVTITAEKDAAGKITGVTRTAEDTNKSDGARVADGNLTDSTVTVGNVRTLGGLPVTGEQGIAILVIGGAVLVGGSIALMRRNKKKQEMSDLD